MMKRISNFFFENIKVHEIYLVSIKANNEKLLRPKRIELSETLLQLYIYIHRTIHLIRHYK